MIRDEQPRENWPARGRVRAVLLALAMASCARAGETAPAGGAPGEVTGQLVDEKTRRAEDNFLVKAHATSVREEKFSALAVSRAVDPRVREYATQVLAGRQQMTRELAPLITAAGLDAKLAESTAASAAEARESARAEVLQMPEEAPQAADNLPPGVRGRWDRMLNERKLKLLASRSGADFDRAYLALMVEDQKEATHLFQAGAEKTTAPAREFVAKHLPLLQQQLEQAEKLQQSLK